MRNTVYFIGSDATRGAELWKTDGAALGTVLVKDIYPGAGHGIPSVDIKDHNALQGHFRFAA